MHDDFAPVPDITPARLDRQLRFLVEIDRLKIVLRRTPLADGSRLENSAEHSWHIALVAAVLAEHAPADADLTRALRMLLIHDIVEIDAGDTFCYDPAARLDEAEREARAAERLFGLLPEDQAVEFRALWQEFASGVTADACFANAVDRLQPLLLNLHSAGGSWRTHSVTREQVLTRMDPIRGAMPGLWPYVEWVVAEGVTRGYLR